MASRDEQNFYRAVSLLDAGTDMKQVATMCDITYATVMRWNREYQEAKKNGVLDELLDMDVLLLEMAVRGTDVPAQFSEAAAKELVKGVNGLSALQDRMQITATYLVNKIQSQAASVQGTGELLDLVNGLAILQNAFFNKNSTQVNVQNNFNNDGQSSYSSFLSDKPNV